MGLLTILLIVLIALALFGGVGYSRRGAGVDGGRAGFGLGGGIIGLIVVVLLIVLLVNLLS